MHFSPHWNICRPIVDMFVCFSWTQSNREKKHDNPWRVIVSVNIFADGNQKNKTFAHTQFTWLSLLFGAVFILIYFFVYSYCYYYYSQFFYFSLAWLSFFRRMTNEYLCWCICCDCATMRNATGWGESACTIKLLKKITSVCV